MFKSTLITAVISAVLLLSSFSIQAASVILSPVSSTVGLGATAQIELFIDFTDEATLGGGIDVHYDETAADLLSFSFDSVFLPLTDPAFTCPGAGACTPIDQPGKVENIAFGNFSGIGGLFKVGTLEFMTLTAGDILFQSAQTSGAGGAFVSAADFQPMNVNFGSVVLTVVPVPVPAAAWLFVSGLGFLGLIVRRR